MTDEGIGLSPEECAQVFEKFSRADRPEVRKAGGTGLGLSITKNLSGVAIVAFTAHDPRRREAIESGVGHFLGRPFSAADLRLLVEERLSR